MNDDIVSARLTLEPLRSDHAPEMLTVLSDPELYRFDGGQVPSQADLDRRYTALVAGSGDEDEQWLNWIVREVSSGNAIGYVQATVEPAQTEVAWVIGTPWQGQGYASEAAQAMIGWLAAQAAAPAVAWIHDAHVASHKVAEAAGLALTDEVDEDGEHAWR